MTVPDHQTAAPSAQRQPVVSTRFDSPSMPEDIQPLLRRLIGGADGAGPEILDRARTSTTPSLLVAAALLTTDHNDFLARAAEHAATSRDRQLVVVAGTHLDGDDDLFDALVRDHLADHPDDILAAWIAARHPRHHPQHSRTDS
jgi:hypothetical protein